MTLEAKTSDLSHTLKELKALRDACLRMERQFQPSIEAVCPESKCSAQNLLHYLALRGHDLRDLQTRLAAMGLSSLGRSEPNALAALNAVIGVLEKLNNEALSEDKYQACADFSTGPALLAKQSERLLGPPPNGRAVRIMVTMPSEAAQYYQLVKDLIAAGMDVMRINCAHDSKVEWERMVMHAHRANQELHKHCKVLMDLAGPKLRTGAIHKGHHVLHWRISRDALGTVITPARIALVGRDAGNMYDPVDARLPVSEAFLSTLRAGDNVRLVDRRGRKRVLNVVETSENACLCTCERAAYVVSRTALSVQRNGAVAARTQVGTLPFIEEPVRLQPGSLLQVTKENNPPSTAFIAGVPCISCTLPDVFEHVKVGHPIFFDDGKIQGQIQEVHPDYLLVGITHTNGSTAKLRSEKGINLPQTDLETGAITGKDRQDLDFVAANADMVGLSFVRRPEDVLALHRELEARGKPDLGIILKIESRQAFEQLPHIMLAAMRHYPAGIMVARGDLAIEIGFERLAEVQEEILWLSEAAHMPVTWATQVLESLAKTGMPSRAEVTDAAMSVRADCVMLNKGEHIREALTFLDHVLVRMQDHQSKKRSMLRKLSIAQVAIDASA